MLVVLSGSASARSPRQAESLGPVPQRCPDGANDCLGGLSISPTDQSAESPHSLTASYLGGLVVSPHLVHDGQTMTAKISAPPPLTTPCFGAAHCVSGYDWSSFEALGKRVSGCVSGNYLETSCTIKVTAASASPARGVEAWSKVTVGICGPPGCATDEDFYYAQGKGVGLSGYVTDNAGKPVAGAQITIGGQRTTTDKSGFYSAILDPGSYTVTAKGSGDSGTPTQCSPGSVSGSSCTVRLQKADGVASFQIGCGQTSSAAADLTAQSASATTTPSCPLTVSIKTFGSGKSGLGFVQGEADGFPTPFPQFLSAKTTGLANGKCLSGCTNVEVTVTDKRTGAPVSDAEVTASVTPFPRDGLAPYPKGFASDDGHLCRDDEFTLCGSGNFLDRLPPTDDNGRVRFLYWAPGAISRQTVKITVKAQKQTCDPQACSVGLQKGENTRPLTVSFNQLYAKSDGNLTAEQVNVLEEFAQDDGDLGSFALEAGKNFGTEHVLEKAIGKAVEFYAEDAVPGLVAAELAHKVFTAPGEYADITTPLGAQQALTDLFATPLQLATTGLGDVAAEREFDPRLLDAIAGRDGLLRHYGAKLVDLAKRKPLVNQTIKLRVLEVSYCKQGMNCGPGDQTPGIEPFVYLDFEGETPASSHNDKASVFHEAFVLPYNAQFYTDYQYGGKLPPK
jgi:hypothetical protein